MIGRAGFGRMGFTAGTSRCPPKAYLTDENGNRLTDPGGNLLTEG